MSALAPQFSLWVYGVVGGFVALLAPVLLSTIGQLLPARYAQRVGRNYINFGLSRGDIWALHEGEGREYELRGLSRTEEFQNGYTDGSDRVYEDVGLLGHVDADDRKVPFGVTFRGYRPITSPLAAKIAEEYGRKTADAPVVDERLTDRQAMTDGGQTETAHHELSDGVTQQRSVQWLRENALLSRHYDSGHIVETVNACAEIPKAAIANARKTENLLAYAGDPEQPKRAAENAENAERMRSAGQSTFEKLKGPAYFIGGLLTYYVLVDVIASGGGGGGGGGPEAPDVPGTVVPDITPLLDVVLGVL